MHISHPSRRWIYYRLSQRKDSVTAVIEDMGARNLLLPQEKQSLIAFTKEVAEFRRRQHIPEDFSPRAPINKNTIAFLKRWGIYGMWLNDPYVRQAEAYLGEGPIRYALEVMLLGPVSPATIATRLRQRFALTEQRMNPMVVRAYASYFWDYSVWTPSQWTAAIFGWMPKGDKSTLLMALRAPRTPSGASLVLGISDGDIEELSPAEQFSIARHLGWRMFIQHATTEFPSLARTQGAQTALAIMQVASENEDRYRGGSNELLNRLRAIRVHSSAEVIPTIYDVDVVRDALPAAASVDEGVEKIEHPKITKAEKTPAETPEKENV